MAEPSQTEAMTSAISQLNDSIKSFSLGMAEFAKKGVTAPISGIQNIKSDIGGIIQNRRSQAGLTSEQMIQTGFEGVPLATAIAGGGVDLVKSFVGMGKKNEDTPEPTQIAKDYGAGKEIVSSNESLDIVQDLLSHIAIDVEGLVNLNTELLAAWVDQTTLERMMYEELRADSAADRLRQIEEDRERKRGLGKDGKIVPASQVEEAPDGGLLASLAGIFAAIPGFALASKLFSGGLGGITKLFGKLFYPVTIILGIISFVDGFMKGYNEEGIIEGITQGFESLIKNLFDVPLNFLTEVVAWIAGALGFEEVEKTLNKFLEGGGFDLASAVRPAMDFLVEMTETIKSFFSDMIGGLQEGWEKLTSVFTDSREWLESLPWMSFGDEPESPEGSPTLRGAFWSMFGEEEEEKKLEKPIFATDPPVKATPAPLTEDQKEMISEIDPVTGIPKAFIPNTPEYIEDDQLRATLMTSWAPSYVEMKPPTDTRANAAGRMQAAGIEKGSNGNSPVIINNMPVDNSTTSTGGGATTLPIPIDMNTDPTLAIPAQ